MALSAATELELTGLAIEALLTGGAQSYSIGARTVTKLDLNSLQKRMDELRRQVYRESGGGMFRKAVIRRPYR